jgi:hypothetical protein
MEWISVKDRLPEMNQVVLVYNAEFDGNEYSIDEWVTYYERPVEFSTIEIETGEGWSMHEFEEVTHWSPLTPPKD